MNDESSKALNETAEVNSPDVSPTSNQTPEEVKTDEVKAESTEEAKTEEVHTETGGESKKGFSSRVRELANEVKSLKQRLAEVTGASDQSDQPAYVPEVAPGSEVTPEQYQQDVMRRADALVNLRIKQNEAVNRINAEAGEALRSFPELDPDSSKFSKDLSDSITEAVEAHIKANPYGASVKSIVTKLMKPYLGAVAKEVGQSQENLAKQISQTALKPTSVSKQDKSAVEMSIKELEAKLGVVQA